MTSRERRNPPNLRQQELNLEYPDDLADAPDLDIDAELRGAFARAFKHARKNGMSREYIVDRMNLCLPNLRKPITLRQLNAWTATSKEYSEFPARYLPALCWATKYMEPIDVGPLALGLDTIDRRDADALELGRIALARADLQNRERNLKRR